MRKTQLDTSIPSGITLSSGSNGLIIEYRWFSRQTLTLKQTLALVLLSVISIGVLFAFLNTTGFALFDTITDIASFSTQHLFIVGSQLLLPFISITLAVQGIAGLVNKTVISINNSSIEICTTPIPLKLKKTIRSSNIVRIYSQNRSIRMQSNNTCHSTERTVYDVRAVLKDRNDILLISDIEKIEQALLIENKIKSYLYIKNTAVRGDVS